MTAHRVHRLEIEIAAGEIGVAQALLDRVSRMHERRIAPLTDRIFNELSGSDVIHYLDAIDVDLGRVSLDDFENDFCRRLEGSLRTTLRKALGDPDRRRSSAAALDLVESFARTGNVPWWADSRDDRVVAKAIAQVVEDRPEAMLTLVRKMADDTVALARIGRSIDASSLSTLVERAWPSGDEAVAVVRRLLQDDSSNGSSSEAIAEACRRREIVLTMVARAAVRPPPTDVLRRLALAAVEAAESLPRSGETEDDIAGASERELASATDDLATDSAPRSDSRPGGRIAMGDLPRRGAVAPETLPAADNEASAVPLQGPAEPIPHLARFEPGNAARSVRTSAILAPLGSSNDETQWSEVEADHASTAAPAGTAFASVPATPAPSIPSHPPLLPRPPSNSLLSSDSSEVPDSPSFRAPAAPTSPVSPTDSPSLLPSSAPLQPTSSRPRSVSSLPLPTPPHSPPPPASHPAAPPIPLPDPHRALRRRTLAQLDELNVENSGLVILWPFLARFFSRLGLLDEKRQFTSRSSQMQALCLLTVLADNDPDPPEFRLPLAKLLCGCTPESDFMPDQPLAPEQIDECAYLLAALIGQVPILHAMAADRFRAAFLHRPGVLGTHAGTWLLRVEREAHDVVLDSFPWSWAWMKLPWMSEPLRVEW